MHCTTIKSSLVPSMARDKIKTLFIFLSRTICSCAVQMKKKLPPNLAEEACEGKPFFLLPFFSFLSLCVIKQWSYLDNKLNKKSHCFFFSIKLFTDELVKSLNLKKKFPGLQNCIFFEFSLFSFKTRAILFFQALPEVNYTCCTLLNHHQHSAGRMDLRHRMEAILACHPAPSTEWQGWVVISCELLRNRTGPIRFVITFKTFLVLTDHRQLQNYVARSIGHLHTL